MFSNISMVEWRHVRNRWLVLLSLGCAAAAAGCKDDNACSDEVKIAVELRVAVPEDLIISKVTGEMTMEERCELIIDPVYDHVYGCYEQGAGTYTIRLYDVDGKVIYTEQDDVETDGCHAKKVISYVDLTKSQQ